MLKQNVRLQALFKGVNAGGVGILLAAFYNPIWLASVVSSLYFAIALLCFMLLVYWKLPSWLIAEVFALMGGVFL